MQQVLEYSNQTKQRLQWSLSCDLKKADVQVKQGAIAVDEYRCTNQANIFAVGDCTNRTHWTPVAIATGRAFADTVFGNQPRTVNLECIPSALSSRPEAATVGFTEAKAREKFGESLATDKSIGKPAVGNWLSSLLLPFSTRALISS